MSKQPKVTIHRGQPGSVQPNVPPPMSNDQFKQAIANAMRRISQTKGELFDVMGNLITKEFEGMQGAITQVYQVNQTLTIENQELKKHIVELQSKLPKDVKTLQKGETEKPPEK
jgi:regulator of replication initiation timing